MTVIVNQTSNNIVAAGGNTVSTGATLQVGVRGKSAYQVAVDNGFSGTEVEWIASLEGDKGDRGDKGDKGDTGNAAYDDLSDFSLIFENGLV